MMRNYSKANVYSALRNEDVHPALTTPSDEEPIVIAVMGASGAGKTTFINLVSGSQLEVGYGLASKTKEVDFAQFEYGGRNIVLVDTPGFNDSAISDTDTLKTIANWLEATYRSGKLLSGLIYLQRITDNRVGHISYKNIRLFHKLCGEDAMQNIVLCTTMWESLPNEDLGLSRERELADDFWKPMMEQGARIARHNGTFQSARGHIYSFSSLRRTTLSIQKSLGEGKNLSETAAGKEINEDLLALERKHRRDLEEIKREMVDAIQENNARAQSMIMKERTFLENKLAEEKQQREKLVAARNEEVAALKDEISALRRDLYEAKRTSSNRCIIF